MGVSYSNIKNRHLIFSIVHRDLRVSKMETRSSNSDLVKELKQWCCREGIDETHSLMVLAPEGLEVSQIEETMETIKASERSMETGHGV